MGHSLSAVKRERQNVKRQARNKANKSVLKKELKIFEQALAANPAEAGTAYARVQGALDKAARKNAIPKGRADRKKARLALLIGRLQKAKSASATATA